MEFTLAQLVNIAVPLFAIGGAWGGAKVALNGTRERVKALENEAKASRETQVQLIKGMTEVHTKVDILLERNKQ